MSKNSWKANERKARNLAAANYRAKIASQSIDHTEYPDIERYVDEWWEERYLPIILKA